MVNLMTIKDYIKLGDYTEDDMLLEMMLSTAKEDVKVSTGVDVDNLTESQKQVENISDLAICMLVAHWYDNREIFTTKTKVNAIPHSIDSLMRKLKMYDETI